MRLVRLALSVCTVLLLSGFGAAHAQDVYRTEGRWLDDQAHPYQLESLHGGFTVLTMAYGACRRVCSTSLRVMQNVQALADERHVSLNFVVVGLDPTQDKPRDWAALRTDRKLTRPNWRFLSGDEASTSRLARRLGIQYWRYGEHILHDFKIVLLSPEGRIVSSMDAFDRPAQELLP
jgi:cytochrome oxidase Cu insertion factor (SCO1/SenC/PrrC family)